MAGVVVVLASFDLGLLFTGGGGGSFHPAGYQTDRSELKFQPAVLSTRIIIIGIFFGGI